MRFLRERVRSRSGEYGLRELPAGEGLSPGALPALRLRNAAGGETRSLAE